MCVFPARLAAGISPAHHCYILLDANSSFTNHTSGCSGFVYDGAVSKQSCNVVDVGYSSFARKAGTFASIKQNPPT